MRYRVETFENEFQAREAAAMSGVSQTLQRDWRRRGLLDGWGGEGRKKFGASEVALLTVMGILSEAKISVKAAQTYAVSVTPALAIFFDSIDGAYEIEGDDLKSSEVPQFLDEVARNPESRFAFVPLPEESNQSLYFLRSPAEIETAVPSERRWRSGLLLDLQGIAEDIAAKAPRPLIRYVLHEESEE